MQSEEWASVARETFEHSMVPWVGVRHAAWLRGWSRPHPTDPRGLVQVPQPVYRLFQQRTLGQHISREQLEGLGYPRVPGEDELGRVRRALHQALTHCDWDRARELDRQLRELTDLVSDRHTALTTAPRRRA